jgi:hypothetical protein
MADLASTLKNVGSNLASDIPIGAEKLARAGAKEVGNIVGASTRNYAEDQIRETSIGEGVLETAARVNRARRNTQRAVAAAQTAYAAGAAVGSAAAAGTSAAAAGIGSFLTWLTSPGWAPIVAIIGIVLGVFLIFEFVTQIGQNASNPVNIGKYVIECGAEGREDTTTCVAEKVTTSSAEGTARSAADKALERQGAFNN